MRNRQQKSTQYVMAYENAQAQWHQVFGAEALITRAVRMNTIHATVAAGGPLEGVNP